MDQHNSYPLKDWQKAIVKYVSGTTDDATSFQMKMHKKYNGKIGCPSNLISNMVLQGKKSLHRRMRIIKNE